MKAYAAVRDGESYVETVSTSDQRAMVKWMADVVGFKTPEGMGDFAIREKFDQLANGAKIEPVEVTYG